LLYFADRTQVRIISSFIHHPVLDTDGCGFDKLHVYVILVETYV